jgi:hypothetical protein
VVDEDKSNNLIENSKEDITEYDIMIFKDIDNYIKD